jgi:capsular polysaccharide biosynthesis protein
MTIERAFSGGFGRFERSFLDRVHEFWHTNDPSQLLEATSLLRELDARTEHHNDPSALQQLTVTGWALPTAGFRFRSSALRRLNPGYDIRIERYARRELGRRATLFRAGFRVTATGTRALPPLAFQVADARGAVRPLRRSNPEADFQSSFFPGIRPEDEATVDYGFGFIDSIRQTSVPDDQNQATWLAALVLRFPAEVREAVDTPQADAVSIEVARLAKLFPSQAFWADRLELAALGASGEYRSDLSAVRVVRTDDAEERIPERAIPVPRSEPAGHITHFAPDSVLLSAPDENWRTYENARLQNGGTLLVDNELIVYEGSSDPRRDFVAGNQYTVFGSQTHPEQALVRLFPRAEGQIDEAILLSGRNDANWFHWLGEYLPRVMQIGGELSPDIPLLVSARTPSNGIEALRKLTDRNLIVVDTDRLQSVRRLHVLAPPVQILDSTRTPWREGLRLNPAPLRAMRAAWGLSHDADHNGSAVFLRRHSRHRGLTNEQHLVTIARRHGLEIRDPGVMSFEEQVELFSGARLLVGASGAVMANYLMMSRGSQILGLTSDALTDFVLPAALASLAGAKFSYISGPPRRPVSAFTVKNEWIQSDFSVNAAAFEAELLAALAM